MDWSAIEFDGINLGDKRLNERARRLLSSLYSKPESSIPGSHKGWDETKAAYRFMSNEKVNFEKILEPHIESTIQRIKEHKTILVAQDTSELDYSKQEKKSGRGPTNYSSRKGTYIHPLLALTESGLCLGLLDAQVWCRDVIGNREDYLKKPIEEKESFRWLEELREVNEIGGLLPQHDFVMLADRESDIYELLDEPLNSNVNYIIRGYHNRVLETGGNLREALELAPVLGETEFTFKERGSNSCREVKQEIRVEKVKIKPSPARGQRKHEGSAELTAILAREIGAKRGVEPIEWLLLTSLDVNGIEDALKIIKYYLFRWKIEVYFKVLKSGCKIEELQLDGLDRLSNCLAFYMVIAWRVMYLMQLGRECPTLKCDLFFAEVEWETAYKIHHKKQAPKEPPPLNEMIRIVAQIGGFLNRASDGEPGPKHLWIGIQRIRDFVYAIDIHKLLEGNTCG